MIYEVQLHANHDVLVKRFKEAGTANRCAMRLEEQFAENEVRLWQADSVRADKLVNARLIYSRNAERFKQLA